MGQTLEDVKAMIGKKVTVRRTEAFNKTLKGSISAHNINGTLSFAGPNAYLGIPKQVTISRTPVEVLSWDDVKLFVED